ncbi:Autophagy protein 22 [Chytridiales sp. JEL 0842]|nr:Autophagy protein 22 [Chytridiales sp. JEL 0842]
MGKSDFELHTLDHVPSPDEEEIILAHTGLPDQWEGMDNSPVEHEELKAWYCFGWAETGYSAIGTAIYLPLVIENLAATSSFERDDLTKPCNTSVPSYSCAVQVGSLWLDPSSFFFYCTTISVIGQIILYISMGSLADFGGLRKFFLLLFSVIAIGFGLGNLVIITPSLFWLAALFFIFGNMAYGASSIFHYAWVPLLARNHPEMIAARESTSLSAKEKHVISDRLTNHISTRGFVWQYVSAVLQLSVAAAIAFFMQDGRPYGLTSTYGLQIGVAFASFWFLVCLYPVVKSLKPRPGPPLPKGENPAFVSIKAIGNAFRKCRKLKNLFFFLIGWCLYSDGFSTLISVSILYGQTELGINQIQLILAGIEVPLVAGIGNLFWNWFQRRYNITTRKLLLIQAVMYAVLPCYGILGFWAPFGLKYKFEFFILAAYHGFLLGGTQSTCRSLFAALLPPGFESEFFSLYAITDKGSAWVGPLVVGAIRDAASANPEGRKRFPFVFLFVVMVIPIYFFWLVDVEEGLNEGKEYSKKQMMKVLHGVDEDKVKQDAGH